MNKTKSHMKINNPSTKKLKKEHSELTTELQILNKNLLVLKEVVRQRQKKLRKVNTDLIHKATRGPFLSVAPSLFEQSSNFLPSRSKAILTCLQGGKA